MCFADCSLSEASIYNYYLKNYPKICNQHITLNIFSYNFNFVCPACLATKWIYFQRDVSVRLSCQLKHKILEYFILLYRTNWAIRRICGKNQTSRKSSNSETFPQTQILIKNIIWYHDLLHGMHQELHRAWRA